MCARQQIPVGTTEPATSVPSKIRKWMRSGYLEWDQINHGWKRKFVALFLQEDTGLIIEGTIAIVVLDGEEVIVRRSLVSSLIYLK